MVVWLVGQVQSRVMLRGRLFYPLDNSKLTQVPLECTLPAELSTEVSPAHLAGWWTCSVSDVLCAAEASDRQWAVLSKLFWLAPVESRQLDVGEVVEMAVLSECTSEDGHRYTSHSFEATDGSTETHIISGSPEMGILPIPLLSCEALREALERHFGMPTTWRVAEEAPAVLHSRSLTR